MEQKKRFKIKNNVSALKIIIGTLLVLFLVMALAGFIYSMDYYRALPEPELVRNITDEIDVIKDGNMLLFQADDSGTGLIFYPGGKVEAIAYEPLLKILAANGMNCVLVEMPFHLAVFDPDAAKEVFERYPDIHTWYLAGHSLGGAMAASYAADHPEDVAGLILLAAYPTKELPKDMQVLSIYGDMDHVLNMENYTSNISQVDQITEIIITGGNHAQFGNYGMQKGDGTALIAPEEQWQQTADAMIHFMNK